MQAAIVTGGLGFLGSHLVESLTNHGVRVTVIDNASTGNRNNLRDLLGNDIRLIDCDVSEPWPRCQLPEAADAIFHLASPASPTQYRQLAIETLLCNSYGTKNALDCALAYGARFIFASTSEIYGTPAVSPQPESYWGHVNPVGPRACYDESKRFGEALTLEYVRRYNVDARIARLFNSFGPRMQANDGRVIPTLIVQALDRHPLTIYGTGQQTRSFCYVSDTIRALFQLAVTPQLQGEVLNIGSPVSHSIVEIAQAICQICSVPPSLTFQPSRPDDPTNRCPDIGKARRLLGWEPTIPLQEGLIQTVNYFRCL